MFTSYEQLASEAIEKYNLDANRVLKAMKIAQGKTNIYNNHCPTGEFDVRSSKGGWYHVNTKEKTCTCPDSTFGNTCKHRIAVWMYTQSNARHIAEVRRVDVSQIMHELGYE
jgi:hypothetical protein